MWRFVEKKKKENKWGRIGKSYEELLKKLKRNLKEMWKLCGNVKGQTNSRDQKVTI